MKQRVVITGLGLLTPCGEGWKPYWEACVQGKSFIRKIKNTDLSAFGDVYGGEIDNFKPRSVVNNKKNLKLMSEDSKFAVVASHYAIEDAKLSLNELDLKRIGVIFGTGMINNDLSELGRGLQQGFEGEEFSNKKFGKDGVELLYPLWMLKYLPNMPACHIGIEHQLKGPCNTTTISSAAGGAAIGEAFRIIERGDADILLAGGADSKTNAMALSRFHSLNILSDCNETPEKSYLPFSSKSRGLVSGDGAGVIVLESLDSAKKRGAEIYAEIVGFGSGSDFYDDPNKPDDFQGKIVSMQTALKDAGIEPQDIDMLVANGAGIPSHDLSEANAIDCVFESSLPNVVAIKPITGHLVHGAGGVETAAAVLAVNKNQNLKTAFADEDIHFENIDVKDIQFSMINSFGFCGQNVTLIFKKWSQA